MDCRCGNPMVQITNGHWLCQQTWCGRFVIVGGNEAKAWLRTEPQELPQPISGREVVIQGRMFRIVLQELPSLPNGGYGLWGPVTPNTFNEIRIGELNIALGTSFRRSDFD